MTENIRKGLEYEHQILKYLTSIGYVGYMWSNVPVKVLIETGVFTNYHLKRLYHKNHIAEGNPFPDRGCDLYLLSPDGKWTIVQCKNYEKLVNRTDLAGFWYMIGTRIHLKGLIVSNSGLTTSLSTEIVPFSDKLTSMIIPYQEPRNNGVEEAKGREAEIDEDIEEVQPIVLRDYQREAIDVCVQQRRAVCSLPCGCGKTYVGIYWGMRFDVVIVFSPLRVFASQNLDRFADITDYAGQRHPILVDSDTKGVRDITKIKRMLKTHQRVVLSATYDSADVIVALQEALQGRSVGIIVDEFHNLTYNQVVAPEADEDGEADEETDMFKVLKQDTYNFLFLSATPRVFDIEDDAIPDLIGPTTYTMPFRSAIEAGHICDYDIYIPSLLDVEKQDRKELYQEVGLQQLNEEITIMAQFLLRGMDENGHRRCIAYFSTQEEANEFASTISQLTEFYGRHINADVIIASTTQHTRTGILQRFAENHDGFHILCSVHILDECVDIPKCDSIFLSRSTDNKIRTIQRICRAIRKDSLNPLKRAGVYFWTNEQSEMITTIMNLKEYDTGFTPDKVKICHAKEAAKVVKTVEEQSAKEKVEAKLIQDVIIGVKRIKTFDERVEELRVYLAENDNVYPTGSTKTKEENINVYRLAQWISDQRKNKDKLSRDRINKLQELPGWQWNIFEENWIQNWQKLFEHLAENDNVYPTESAKAMRKNINACRLVQWISDQRKLKNKDKLSQDRIAKLQELSGWQWNIFEEDWIQNWQKLREHLAENDNVYPAKSAKTKRENINAYRLAKWIINQRQNKDKLSQDKIAKLQELSGWQWNPLEEDWIQNWQKLREHLAENDNVYPTVSAKTKRENINAYRLGLWISTQRNLKNKYKLLQDRIDKLQELPGWQWNILEDWEINLQKLIDYLAANDNIYPTFSAKTKRENINAYQLAIWISTQRKLKNKDILSQDKITKLQELPRWQWSIRK